MMNNLLTNPTATYNNPTFEQTGGKQDLILKIMKDMSTYLNQRQLSELNKVLLDNLKDVEILEQELVYDEDYEQENDRLLDNFLDSKKLEGLSDRSLTYYNDQISTVIKGIDKPIREIRTDDLRTWLRKYQETGVKNTTVDNVRRVLSSFFGWLSVEEYIFKNPMARIHRVKSPKILRTPFSSFDIEKLRLNCKDLRERAIMEFLLCTGMRVNECAQLNRNDVDFHEREVIVFGKGSKERMCYLNETAEIHLKRYLDARTDDNPALFASVKSFNGKYNRIDRNYIGTLMRNLGERAGVPKCHPHRFRRTMATHALQHGMPVEQIQKLLGHESIATTELYITIDSEEVKYSHKKYVTS